MNLENPRIGILVLNHNGQNWLPTIYQSIRDQSYPRAKMYLVDNASTDSSVEWTQKEYPEVTILRMPSNLGYCMAYNLAMKQAFVDQCDWAIWANNDVKLEAACLSSMVAAAQSDARIGVAGPAFLHWEKDEPNYYILGNCPQAIPAIESRSKDLIDSDWVEGSFLMVRRGCYESVGPLDPFLFLYWEEADFCRRARFQGWRVILAPAALARHYAGGWSKSDRGKKNRANYLRTRNLYIYELADPSRSFYNNFIDGFHLFLVNMKEAIQSGPLPMTLYASAYAAVLKDILKIYHKWNRDRKCGHPPLLNKKFSNVQPQVIPANP